MKFTKSLVMTLFIAFVSLQQPVQASSQKPQKNEHSLEVYFYFLLPQLLGISNGFPIIFMPINIDDSIDSREAQLQEQRIIKDQQKHKLKNKRKMPKNYKNQSGNRQLYGMTNRALNNRGANNY